MDNTKNKNLEVASCSILHYLLEIIQGQDLGNMYKLAALTVLNKLLLSEPGNNLKTSCLNMDLTTTLVSVLETCQLGSPSYLEYVMIALEVLEKLSRLSLCDIECLITEPLIRNFLAYLDTDAEFYRFPDLTKQCLVAVCENKQLIGQVKVIPMAKQQLEYIHLHTRQRLKRIHHLPDMINICAMFNTESSQDLDITQHLMEKHMAWPGHFPGDLKCDPDLKWLDIIVTEVLDGAMFWAQIGEQSIKVLLVEDHSVEVFCIDYGFILQVPETRVYILPEHLNVTCCAKKISLCTVAGIQPPPLHEGITQNVAVILANLSKQSSQIGHMLNRMDGFFVIKTLLQTCPSISVITELVILLHNITSDYSVNLEITKYSFVTVLLDIIRRYNNHSNTDDAVPTTPKMKSIGNLSHAEKFLLVRCILCLNNILYRNNENRCQFYEHQGIDVILNIFLQVKTTDALYVVSIVLLRVFSGRTGSYSKESFIKCTDQHLVDNVQCIVSPKNKAANNDDPEYGFVKLMATCTSPSKSGVLRRKIKKKSVVQSSSPKLQLRQNTVLESSENKKIMEEMKSLHIPCDIACEPDDISLDEDSLSSTESSTSLLPNPEVETTYMVGKRVQIYNDTTHEVIAEKNVDCVSRIQIAEHVCGMLNSGKGGTIYFGINKNQEVFGLELTRDEKDCFRLGIDTLMFKEICPVLLHSQFDFSAKPVTDPNMNAFIPDRYVIEICIKPCKDSIYMLFDGGCFYRFGGTTSSITRQELRQLVCDNEVKNYTAKLQKLTWAKEKLLQTLKLKNS